MPKTVSYSPVYSIDIEADASGPRSGLIALRGSNGGVERVSIGPAGSDVVFSTLGTGAQRTAFLTILDLAVAAARVKIGDV